MLIIETGKSNSVQMSIPFPCSMNCIQAGHSNLDGACGCEVLDHYCWVDNWPGWKEHMIHRWESECTRRFSGYSELFLFNLSGVLFSHQGFPIMNSSHISFQMNTIFFIELILYKYGGMLIIVLKPWEVLLKFVKNDLLPGKDKVPEHGCALMGD